ncbi:MAG: hypothetical protein NTZ01_01840 [Verrucomicrobia bacterium]|nr:hypothetical protein [Verrucomicrobiota bacterium]
MPQSDKQHSLPSHKPGSIEHTSLACTDPASRQKALQTAFDYRGDVTLDLHGGKKIIGFIFRYDEKPDEVHLFVLHGKDSVSQIIKASTVTSIHFTGEDTAFGKSWDNWTTKAENERLKEAERLARESVARGEL